jgi:hypothetical protein
MKKALYILCDYLTKNALEEDADSIRKLFEGTKNIGEDWDVEEEERLLTPSPLEIDKKIRETNPRPGWNLPEDSVGLGSMDLSWLNSDLEIGNIEKKQITPQFISAIKGLGDGSEPKYVGSGLYGTVWDIGNDRLLKIYGLGSDQEKTDLAREMVFEGAQYAENEVMIYASGKFLLDDPSDWMRYGWKVMERLINDDELSKIDKDALDELERILEQIEGEIEEVLRVNRGPLYEHVKRFIHLGISYEEVQARDTDEEKKFLAKSLGESGVKRSINVITDNIIKGLRDSDYGDDVTIEETNDITKVFDLNPNWFKELVRQMLILTLTDRTDTHIGNVGIRPSTGLFVFFDA